MEIHLYVAMAVQLFDMKLLDPLPTAVRTQQEEAYRTNSVHLVH